MQSNSTYANCAICEVCDKTFQSSKIIYTCVNTDAKGAVFNDFDSFMLNRIQCKYCRSYFTYEIPMFVYSLNKGYGIFTVSCNFNSAKIQRILEYTGNKNMQIYHVPFYAFAVEIERIYKYNLDYNYVTDVKNKLFNADKLNIAEEFILFDSVNNNKLLFKRYDFLYNVKDEYEANYTLQGEKNNE